MSCSCFLKTNLTLRSGVITVVPFAGDLRASNDVSSDATEVFQALMGRSSFMRINDKNHSQKVQKPRVLFPEQRVQRGSPLDKCSMLCRQHSSEAVPCPGIKSFACEVRVLLVLSCSDHSPRKDPYGAFYQGQVLRVVVRRKKEFSGIELC